MVSAQQSSKSVMLRSALLLLALSSQAFAGSSLRKTVSLDGTWEIAQGGMAEIPQQFEHTIAVPGLVTMAIPAFTDVGRVSEQREAFWCRRVFTLDSEVPQVATLKINKAKFGTAVYLNGEKIGEHLPCFTPSYFNVRDLLKGKGQDNELIIRVGANRESLPAHISGGYDVEKELYIPGIYDSVGLILTGDLQISRMQAAPDLEQQSVRVQTVIHNAGSNDQTTSISWVVSEKVSGKIGGSETRESIVVPAGERVTLDTLIPIDDVKLWSTDSPFLYSLKAKTLNDDLSVVFGMRSFRFDQETGFAQLNGKPTYLKGSNVCIFRFFEDPACGDKPWNEEWVRTLHRRFKSMNWDTIRYCIGFPPEMWYRIADEEGLMIQNEYPIWLAGQDWGDRKLTGDQLTLEFTDWIHEHANHPCVVIWDASNETGQNPDVMGEAIKRVRKLDLSNRPWENSRGKVGEKGDCFESHPYLFQNWHFRISDLAAVPRFPFSRQNPLQYYDPPSIIINEYGWLWIDRAGKPCKLTPLVYKNLLGDNANVEQTRELYARYLGILTEFWRSSRQAAGVLHFCGLGYSRPGGFTSDNFIDFDDLIFEPHFEKYVRYAFAPVGIAIEAWPQDIPTADSPQKTTIDVTVINDIPKNWKGSVRLLLLEDKKQILEIEREATANASKTAQLSFDVTYPNKVGSYALVARLLDSKGELITQSERLFNVVDGKDLVASQSISFGKPAEASSSRPDMPGRNHAPENVLDGSMFTRWTSNADIKQQWIAVDLEELHAVDGVEIFWER
ncbi:MAG: hypothetical protein DRP64_12700, partial [Verrucomicrobia bacterium]